MTSKKRDHKIQAIGCKLCGDMNIGRRIKSHVKHRHSIEYQFYKQCFEESGEIIWDALRDTESTIAGQKSRVIFHVLIRRFIVPITSDDPS